MKLRDKHQNLQDSTDILAVPNIARDLVTSLCGEYIGGGSYRDVYEYNLDHRYVIKIERNNTDCNINEYNIWEMVEGYKGDLEWVKEWFCPVKWISPNGRILVMRKTSSNFKVEIPAKVPAFFWDVKPDNFGWIGKKYVCHDYGQFYDMVKFTKKMKKNSW